MNKLWKSGLSLLLVAILLCGAAPLGALLGLELPDWADGGLGTIAQAAAPKTGDDGITNWDFIDPVTHLTTVPEGYTGIYTASDLDDVRNHLDGNFILMNDIDLADWGAWEPIGIAAGDLINGGDIDVRGTEYTGIFDGNGYSVRNMKIRPQEKNELGRVQTGLFGAALNGEIKNLAMANTDFDLSPIWDANYDSVNGPCTVGGIVAMALSEKITNCFNTGSVSAPSEIVNFFAGISGFSVYTEIKKCYNTGDITIGIVGETSLDVAVGGITGAIASGLVEECYNTGDINMVTGFEIGGIAGVEVISNFNNCYNTGDVINHFPSYGESCVVGGIIGANRNSIQSGYFGYYHGSMAASITSCYNTGDLSASCSSGGVVGLADTGIASFTIENSYYLNTASDAIGRNGTSTLSNVKALTPQEMQTRSSFTGFDFDTIWEIDPDRNSGYPFFSAPPAYTVTFTDYDGTVLHTQQGVAYGSAATAPADPVRVGYDFAGWSAALHNVTADLTVAATYTPKTGTVDITTPGDYNLDDNVYADLIIHANNVKIRNFSVTGNVLVYGNTVDIANVKNIGGNLTITGADVKITNAAIKGNVSIAADKTYINNSTICGDLTVEKQVANGEVTLKGVNASNTTVYVKGGGAHSVILEDSVIKGIVVDKPAAADAETVSIKAVGSTKINSAVVRSSASLLDLTTDGNAFGNTELAAAIPSGAQVSLNGNFPQVAVSASGVTVALPEGSAIRTLHVTSGASNVAFQGAGAIELAQIDRNAADSIHFDTTPVKTETTGKLSILDIILNFFASIIAFIRNLFR